MIFLDKWYQACGAERYCHILRSFLDCFPNYNEYPSNAFVVGVEFPREEEKWCPTLKVDLEVSRWMGGDYQIQQGVLRALGILDIPTESYMNFLSGLGPTKMSKETSCFHRLVGFGFETNESVHINTYFEPYIGTLPSRIQGGPQLNRTVSIAISDGLLFLKNIQNSNGSWADFRLPVGESDIWVTAYVLFHLTYFQKHSSMNLLLFMKKAVDWLMISQKKTGGWSYNLDTGEDSDSTSLAILALRSLKEESKLENGLERLLQYFQNDGGISTYLNNAEEGKAWATSHCDVTPLSLLALKGKMSVSNEQKALDFFINQQLADGLWPSYWWVSPLYSTYVTLIWFVKNHHKIPYKDVLVQTLLRLNPSGAFETALNMGCLSFVGKGASSRFTDLVTDILKTQSNDGSWPSSATLRLTHPTVKRPWIRIDAGPIYRDLRNVFTTATVVGALSLAINRPVTL
jgi:hypothetical protein